MRLLLSITCCLPLVSATLWADDLVDEASVAMKKATGYFHSNVAVHGGYVYFCSLDQTQRWGEGVASKDQVWVQSPATPTVGLAYLKAYEATRDQQFLNAATNAAEALVYGQLKSGGWTNCIDFNPRGERTANYRTGKGRGKNNSSLDDGQTQSALQLLIAVDKANEFQHTGIHQAAKIGLEALLDAQFANGGFPQVWTGPVTAQPVIAANYPEYDWRTEGRIKEYWTLYTLNDNVCGYVADTLVLASRVYNDEVYLKSLRHLGDFLLLAQMPDPQPAWAQQYNYNMQPVWARRFEPPGISGDESQEAIETLLRIAEVTGDSKYLTGIPKAIEYLTRSLLSDGQLARYYELRTNTPLYMKRRGKEYSLTYDDTDLPSHYGWKTKSKLDELATSFDRLKAAEPLRLPVVSPDEVRRIIADLDQHGRWVSVRGTERLVGQAKMKPGTRYLSSEVFSRNLVQLAEYVTAGKSEVESR